MLSLVVSHVFSEAKYIAGLVSGKMCWFLPYLHLDWLSRSLKAFSFADPLENKNKFLTTVGFDVFVLSSSKLKDGWKWKILGK